MDLLTWEIDGEYYFAGEPTCVAFGMVASADCDTSEYVCTAGKIGSLAQQGALLLAALQNEGLHEHCPTRLQDCDFSTLVARAPHECVPLVGKTAYDETFCDCLLVAMSSSVSDCNMLGESIWDRYYNVTSICHLR